MTLSSGVRLGPYEILAPVGAGGMGEVYRANDSRLDRRVAVKVLSPSLTASAELRARFEREARAISSLQHPHICTLYDVGREGDVDYLVMELLDGESLTHRIARGGLPIAEALHVGIQIAEALETAHRGGIVHRDLKPGNVFLTDHGVKLLDFGLAKLQHEDADAAMASAMPTARHSLSLTREGAILGTVQYMAPEQLEGIAADARSDVFALGAVLYEMVTGQRAFSGETQAKLVSSIMHDVPPPVSSLVSMSPPALDRLIATCLAKNPKDRWYAVRDVRLQLEGIAAAAANPSGLAVAAVPRTRRREWLAWSLAGAAVTAIVAMIATSSLFRPDPVSTGLVRFQVAIPPKTRQVGPPRLSPDGRHLAFSAIDEQGSRRIWLRAFDSVEAKPLVGTEGVSSPFWSPDSRLLGFVAGGKLKKIAVEGGPPQIICDASVWGGHGTWAEDGTILFDWAGTNIRRVSASGGKSTQLIAPAKETVVAWPKFLPGGRKFLYGISGSDGLQLRIANIDGTDARELLRGVTQAEYAPPGYLLFVRGSTLVGQRFDIAAGTFSGEPIPLAEGLETGTLGTAPISVTPTGVLAYRTGSATMSQFVWLDREGRSLAAFAEPTNNNFDLSPDGRWLVYDMFGTDGFKVWVRDVKRGVSSRFTFEPGEEMCPLFTSDGGDVLFARKVSNQPWQLVIRALDRSGGERVLHRDPHFLCPEAFTPDGKSVLFDRYKSEDEYDLWQMELGRPSSAVPLVVSTFSSSRPSISPDGRWLALQGNDSGQDEIYVMALDGTGARWQVSTGGGREPEWGPRGGELLYVSPENRLMRVAVRAGPGFDAGEAAPLFTMAISPVLGRNRYFVAPEGDRFLIQSPQPSSEPMTVVLNWMHELPRE